MPLPLSPDVEGFALVTQACLNKIMHIQNGNTTLRLNRYDGNIAAFVQINRCQAIPLQSRSDNSQIQYSEEFLLNCRQSTPVEDLNFQPPTLTTTQFLGTAKHAKAISRTGRRARVAIIMVIIHTTRRDSLRGSQKFRN